MYIHIHIHSNLVLNLLIFIGDVNITQPCPYDLSSPIPKKEMKGRVGRGESLRTTSIQQLPHVSNKHCISNWILPMVQQGRGQKETIGPHCSLSACQSLLSHDLLTYLWLAVICVHWLRPLASKTAGVAASHSDTPCSCTACRAWILV